MPPETSEVTNETPTTPQAIAGNSPEARNPDGSMKDGLSGQPMETKEPPKPETPGETKSTPTTSESKPGETKPSLLNQKDEAKPDSIATGAPEKYEFKDLPSGFEVTEKAQDFFKSNQMSQAQADAAIKFYHELATEAQQAPFKLWQDMNDGWVKEVTADPEYKGDIGNVKATISKFVDSIEDRALADSLREAMDLTGAGNNPAFVKFMFRMGQRLTEGKHVAASGPSAFGQRAPGTGERPTAAHSLYPRLP